MSAGADGKERVCGGVLEGGEGLVLLQALRKVLGALCTEVIVLQTASRTRIATSGGADAVVQKRAQTKMQARGGGQWE